MYLSLPVDRFVPTKLIHVRNKDKPWFNGGSRRAFDSSKRLIFAGVVIALELTGISL